jgi:hypothetical protein
LTTDGTDNTDAAFCAVTRWSFHPCIGAIGGYSAGLSVAGLQQKFDNRFHGFTGKGVTRVARIKTRGHHKAPVF